MSSDMRTAAPGLADLFRPDRLAAGVGNHEDPVTEVRGTNGRCRNALPLRVIPEAGQGPEYVSHSSNKEAWDVLHEDVARSKMANGASKLGPQPPLVILSTSFPGEADGLAGEPSTDDVDGFELTRVHLLDVPVARNVRPVLRQHPLAVGVMLYLPSDFHAGTLQTEVEATDAGEQRADRQLHATLLDDPSRRSPRRSASAGWACLARWWAEQSAWQFSGSRWPPG
jgi:hypothetical protein